eukprot:PhM_4_TR6997/c0_g1_i1/m.43259/K20346/TMED4_9_11; p24 family protein alpha
MRSYSSSSLAMTRLYHVLFISSVVVLLSPLQGACAFYFLTSPKSQTCFSDEAPLTGETVYIHYRVTNFRIGRDNLILSLYDSQNTPREVLSSSKPEDTIHIDPHYEGAGGSTSPTFRYCIELSLIKTEYEASPADPTDKHHMQHKVYLEIDTHKNPDAKDEFAGRTLLQAYEAKVSKIRTSLADVQAVGEALGSRQQRFEMTSSSTFSRLAWWMVAHLVIMVGTVAWQITHLKSFFRAKKLV